MKAETISGRTQFGWLLLILLTAACLRLHDIADSPPGLTHDEADHGITAWEIVNGSREIYFTVGYGREPLFDYTTALLMVFLGPTYLAGRLVSVFLSLILIASMYAWARYAFDDTTALLTIAGLGVGFWPLMTSRQSLRSELLPTLFVLALIFFWKGLRRSGSERLTAKSRQFLTAGILLGLTFYTYIPSRVMWVAFPLVLGYVLLVNHARFRQLLSGTVLMLISAATVASPLFYYLATHPDAEERIRQLSAPLTLLIQGNARPLVQNALASLGVLAFSGDTSWRYNIPGRPLLQPIMAALFLAGLLLTIWRVVRVNGKWERATAHALILIWLITGLLPVLITGPELSMTQAIGMQPVLFLFPALALSAGGKGLSRIQINLARDESPFTGERLKLLAVLLLFSNTALVTMRDYFILWTNAPEVRVQYESTMVAAIRYLDEHVSGAAAISTITPGRFHSPAVAQMVGRNESLSLRWFDGRYSLLLPGEPQSYVVVPGFTPIPLALRSFVESGHLVDSLPLRPTDLDRPLDIYRFDGPEASAAWRDEFDVLTEEIELPVSFGGAADLLGYDVKPLISRSGETTQVLTLWRVQNPVENALIFTHLQRADQTPLAQADRLDVPSHGWHSGDFFIQLHELELPPGMEPGSYPLVVGMCVLTSSPCERLPITEGDRDHNLLTLTMLSVSQ